MQDFFEEDSLLTNEGEGLDLKRYLRAMLRKWWIIAILFLGISAPWLLHLKKQPPVFRAEAQMSFERVTGGTVSENEIQSRIIRMRSRSFAEEVTAELGLSMQLVQEEGVSFLNRQDVFDTFFTNRDPIPGSYSIRFFPSGYCSIYHRTQRIDSLHVVSCVDDSISFNGITFSLTPDIHRNRREVKFNIRPFNSAVKTLRSRERIVSNRAGTLMRVRLRDRNPVLAAQTANMLAELFVEKTKQMHRDRTSIFKNFLQEQLTHAQKELNKTDYQLKSFRNVHIRGLDTETKSTILRLEGLSTAINRARLNKDELNLLLGKLDPESEYFETSVISRYVYRQITNHPTFEQDADMTIARQQLQDMEGRRGNLLKRFTYENPTVVEISGRISLQEEKVYQLGKNKVKSLENDIVTMQNRSDEVQKRLGSLPEEELKFIQLARQRTVNEDIYQLLLKRTKEAQINEAVESVNVSILDSALPPTRPMTRDKKKNAILGVLFSLFLGVGVVFVIEFFDKSIKSSGDIKRYLKMPILGVIPVVKFDEYELRDSEKAKSISSQIVTHDYSPTPVGEAYRSLRTNLLFRKSKQPLRTLLISSVFPGEGKSFTAANLAITLAQQKTRTLLIDADLRRGVLHNSFNCKKKPGLTNYLTGVATLDKVVHETYIPNLSLITCGSLIPNPSEILGAAQMKRFMDGITGRFDFVLIDTPPLTGASDAIILSTLVDGVSILIRSGKSNRDIVKNKLGLFGNVKSSILGVILNGAGVEIAHEGYSYYRY